ncbi:MAG: histidine kinase [Arachnia sp.]
MLRELNARVRKVPSWWLEPILALLLLALSVGTSLGFSLPPHAWVASIMICLGASLAALSPFVGAAITLVGILIQFTLDPGLLGPSGLVVVVHVFAAVRLRLKIVPIIIVVLGGVELAALTFHSTDGIASAISTGVLLAVLITLSVGAGIVWRRSLELLALERETANRRLHDLRLDLARDLHDTVAQTLSHASMRSYMVAADPLLPDESRDELESIAQDCSSAAQDLRQLLSSLRDSELLDEVSTYHVADAKALLDSVEQQAQRLRDAGLPCEVNFTIDSISAARATTLAKITVEAASNMIKHATLGGTTRIVMSANAEAFTAEYSNATSLREIRPTRGFGLVGIRERANLLKGTCSSELKDGRWILKVTLPTGYEVRALSESESPEPLR